MIYVCVALSKLHTKLIWDYWALYTTPRKSVDIWNDQHVFTGRSVRFFGIVQNTDSLGQKYKPMVPLLLLQGKSAGDWRNKIAYNFPQERLKYSLWGYLTISFIHVASTAHVTCAHLQFNFGCGLQVLGPFSSTKFGPVENHVTLRLNVTCVHLWTVWRSRRVQQPGPDIFLQSVSQWHFGGQELPKITVCPASSHWDKLGCWLL